MPLDITGTSLDSTLARPTNSHLPALAQKSARQHTHNTKTNIVVVVARVIVVAIGGTAIIRIIVERTATFLCLPLLYCILDFGFWIDNMKERTIT